MKIKTILLMIIVLLSTGFLGVYAQHHEHMHGKHITKIVEEDKIKIVVDIMDHKAHEKMMEAMKMPMQHMKHNQNHHIMITLIDKDSGKMIEKAKIQAFLIDANNKKQTLKIHDMHHENMHHFGSHLKLKHSTKYKLNLIITIDKKKIDKTVEFQL